MNEMIRETIKHICNVTIENDSDILYDNPYYLNANDIVYVISEMFYNLNIINIKISNNILCNAEFNTVIDIATFIDKAISEQTGSTHVSNNSSNDRSIYD